MFKSLRERIRFATYSVVHRRSLAAQTKWQSKQFARLIAHAYANVPLWRIFLEERHLDPRTIHLGDIGKLPITGKKTYLGRAIDEYTDNSKRLSSHWYKTSGSSGTPFTFLLSDQVLDQKYVDFGSLKFLWWRGIAPLRFAAVKMVRIRLRARQAPHSFFIAVEDYLRSPRNVIAKICEFRPMIVATYPSILSDMARLVSSDTTILWKTPPFLLSLGETLLPSVRAQISNALTSEIYDHYGLEEVGAVGVECVAHDGLHINTESLFVEIVDDAGEPVPDGTVGRVIVTDLFNYNMPFIRYDSEDSGRITLETCRCGLSSPRLWVTGRYSATLTFSGKSFHHLEFDGAMDGFMNEISQYQIAKLSEEEMVARVVPGPAFKNGVDVRLKENLSTLVGPGVGIRIERVERVELSEKGKCQIVRDESGTQ